MKKILILMCLLLLTGCGQISLEDQMQGRWVIVESRGIIDGGEHDYTEFRTFIDLDKKEVTDFKRNSKDEDFIKLQTNQGEDYLVTVTYSENQKTAESKIPENIMVYDIKYYGNFIKFGLRSSKMKHLPY